MQSAPVFLYLLTFCLWRQRNDYRFKSKPPSAVGLITSIKGRLTFYSPLFFKHYRSRRRRRFFQRRWGANGYIGKVVGDSFLRFFIFIATELFLFVCCLWSACVSLPFAPFGRPCWLVVVSSFLEVFAGVRSSLVRVYLLVAPLGRLCLFHS